MRSLILKTPKDPSSLSLKEQNLPSPAANQVRVKMTSMGLNRGDLLYCQGRYFFQSPENSRLGFEGAGIVDALGLDIDSNKIKVGDKVALLPMSFDISQQGCFSEYGVYETDSLIPSPNNVPDSLTGSFWMAFLTAWGGMIDCGNLKPGETVVITAASSSVGLAAIQLAKMTGAKVIAVCSKEDKVEALYQNGADKVICIPSNLESEALTNAIAHYVETVKEETRQKGSDLVFDAVAGPLSHGLVKASSQGGRIIIQGMLDRRPMDIHAGVLMKRRLTLRGYTLDETLENQNKKDQAIRMITQGIEAGQLKPVIASKYSLKDFSLAFDEIKQNKHIGKIILVP